MIWQPTVDIKYDLPQALATMAQADHFQPKPLKAEVIIAQGGTGQMLSLPMNEYLQQCLAKMASTSSLEWWSWKTCTRTGALAH